QPNFSSEVGLTLGLTLASAIVGSGEIAQLLSRMNRKNKLITHPHERSTMKKALFTNIIFMKTFVATYTA
ncbi:MAG: hypothetical protein WAU60_11980, partial [Candidatus Competibacter denitrificans]